MAWPSDLIHCTKQTPFLRDADFSYCPILRSTVVLRADTADHTKSVRKTESGICMMWLSPTELAGAAQDLGRSLKSMLSEKMSKNDFPLLKTWGRETLTA